MQISVLIFPSLKRRPTKREILVCATNLAWTNLVFFIFPANIGNHNVHLKMLDEEMFLEH